MTYEIGKLNHETLLAPMAVAEDALARLDERVARSEVGAGFAERADFFESVSSRLKPDGVYTTWLDRKIGDRGIDTAMHHTLKAIDAGARQATFTDATGAVAAAMAGPPAGALSRTRA